MIVMKDTPLANFTGKRTGRCLNVKNAKAELVLGMERFSRIATSHYNCGSKRFTLFHQQEKHSLPLKSRDN